MNTFSAKSVYFKMFISRILPMLGFALVLGFSLPAQAQNNNFTNATSANWSAASAWSLGVPTSAQDAYHTNVTTGTVAINVTTAAQANSLTLGGSGGTASLVTSANQSLTVGGNITLASGAGAGELRLSGSNSTVTLNGGAGSIINGGGAGLATLNVQGGFSNSVGLLNASVDDLNMGQSGSGTLIITNGQTYNVSSQLRLNNSTASNNATILMNGGTLNYSGPNEIRLNSGAGAGNTAYLILNSNALVAATKIRRQNLGTDAAIEWNDGTIGNYAGTNLTIDAFAGTMNVKLAGTGTHTFNAESGRTITVAATAQLQDKSGEAGTLNKAGGGTLLLQGANTYSGATTISGGTLMLSTNGAIASSSLLSVASGATLDVAAVASGFKIGTNQILQGSGTVIGNTTIEGSLKPGNSPGLLTFNNDLTLAGASSTVMEFLGAGVRGTDYDAVNVGSLLTYDGSLTLDFGATFAQGSYNFNLFDFTNQSGFYDNISLSGDYSGSFTRNGTDWEWSSGNETWNFSQSTGELSLNVIPEPSSLSLLLLGTVVWLRQRRRA